MKYVLTCIQFFSFKKNLITSNYYFFFVYNVGLINICLYNIFFFLIDDCIYIEIYIFGLVKVRGDERVEVFNSIFKCVL